MSQNDGSMIGYGLRYDAPPMSPCAMWCMNEFVCHSESRYSHRKFDECSTRADVAHAPAVHTPLAQSVASEHLSPTAHRAHRAPPQSTSVSPLLRAPSAHEPPASPTTAHAELTSTCDTDAPAANHSTPATSNVSAPSPPDGTSDTICSSRPLATSSACTSPLVCEPTYTMPSRAARPLGRVTAPSTRHSSPCHSE